MKASDCHWVEDRARGTTGPPELPVGCSLKGSVREDSGASPPHVCSLESGSRGTPMEWAVPCNGHQPAWPNHCPPPGPQLDHLLLKTDVACGCELPGGPPPPGRPRCPRCGSHGPFPVCWPESGPKEDTEALGGRRTDTAQAEPTGPDPVPLTLLAQAVGFFHVEPRE